MEITYKVPHSVWQIGSARRREPICIYVLHGPIHFNLTSPVRPFTILRWRGALDEGMPCTPKVLHLSWPMLLTWYISFSAVVSLWIFSFVNVCKTLEAENEFNNQRQHFLSADSVLNVCTDLSLPSSRQPHDIGTVVSLSSLVRKLRHREVKDVAHGHYLADCRMGIGTQVSLIPKLYTLFYFSRLLWSLPSCLVSNQNSVSLWFLVTVFQPRALFKGIWSRSQELCLEMEPCSSSP